MKLLAEAPVCMCLVAWLCRVGVCLISIIVFFHSPQKPERAGVPCAHHNAAITDMW